MVITPYGQRDCPWVLLEIAWTQIAHTDRQQAGFLPNVSLSLAFPPCHVLPVKRPAFWHTFIPPTIRTIILVQLGELEVLIFGKGKGKAITSGVRQQHEQLCESRYLSMSDTLRRNIDCSLARLRESCNIEGRAQDLPGRQMLMQRWSTISLTLCSKY
jgi:hypothetical protein